MEKHPANFVRTKNALKAKHLFFYIHIGFWKCNFFFSVIYTFLFHNIFFLGQYVCVYIYTLFFIIFFPWTPNCTCSQTTTWPLLFLNLWCYGNPMSTGCGKCTAHLFLIQASREVVPESLAWIPESIWLIRSWGTLWTE